MSEGGEARPAGESGAPRRGRNRLLTFLPVLAFAALAGVFLAQLVSGHDPAALPSALIGRPAPDTRLPPLAGLGRPDGAPVPGLALKSGGSGRPVLLNVFASWCGPCRAEHPLLMRLAADKRFDLVAINYKDKPNDARSFLGGLGNPFAALGTDEAGAATIDWGVYGVPESFLLSPAGTILWKQTGPLTEDAVRDGLMPALERTLGARERPAG